MILGSFHRISALAHFCSLHEIKHPFKACFISNFGYRLSLLKVAKGKASDRQGTHFNKRKIYSFLRHHSALSTLN